jgi:hypothetical protein
MSESINTQSSLELLLVTRDEIPAHFYQHLYIHVPQKGGGAELEVVEVFLHRSKRPSCVNRMEKAIGEWKRSPS